MLVVGCWDMPSSDSGRGTSCFDSISQHLRILFFQAQKEIGQQKSSSGGLWLIAYGYCAVAHAAVMYRLGIRYIAFWYEGGSV